MRISGRLPASRWRALRRHAQRCGAGNGRNALLLAVYALVLGRYSRSTRFLLTLMLSSVDRRSHGLQHVMGNLSTTMLMDVDVSVPTVLKGGVGFARMAQGIAKRLLQHLPHGALFSGLDVARELHRRLWLRCLLLPKRCNVVILLQHKPTGRTQRLMPPPLLPSRRL